MKIELKPRMAQCRSPVTKEYETIDSGIDYICCDGQMVGYSFRNNTDPIRLIGIPSEALIAAVRAFIPGKDVIHPNVLLNRDGDPIDIYGDVDEEDEDDSPEDDDDE